MWNGCISNSVFPFDNGLETAISFVALTSRSSIRFN